MKDDLQRLIHQALVSLQNQGLIVIPDNLSVQIQHTKDPAHGDFATNIAMILAKPAKISPKLLAEKIIHAIPNAPFLAAAEIAGPGFINFRLQQTSLNDVIKTILDEGQQFGFEKKPKNKKIHMEYVSANPTGPLHVGHGRGAAYGACVANLLKANGYDVHREYYVNDAGRQMRILAMSVFMRYLQSEGEQIDFPLGAYQGDYIKDIAEEIKKQYGSRFHYTQESIERLMPDIPAENQEARLDAYVEVSQELLGEENFNLIFKAALDSVLNDIKDDLNEFGVIYDNWFCESELFKNGTIAAGIELLKSHGHVYEKEGALWFCATKLGDEKDRVLIRANGQPTYFASDVAYHFYKYQKAYDVIIDIFGADHHGYMARLRSFLKGLGEDPNKLIILLVQFAILYRGKEKVSMSTRSGQFVTLRELRKEVGNDAARFFYVMRKPDQHLDFDLELAKSKSNENPVYYIQYAHARICSVWRQLDASEMLWDKVNGLAHLELLSNQHEKALISKLARYPELIKAACEQYAPHQLAHYLQDLANYFHSYYNAEKFLVDQKELRDARLCLIAAARQVFVSGLTLLGVSAPQEM